MLDLKRGFSGSPATLFITTQLDVTWKAEVQSDKFSQ